MLFNCFMQACGAINVYSCQMCCLDRSFDNALLIIGDDHWTIWALCIRHWTLNTLYGCQMRFPQMWIDQMCILWLYNRGWRPPQWPAEHLEVQLAPNGGCRARLCSVTLRTSLVSSSHNDIPLMGRKLVNPRNTSNGRFRFKPLWIWCQILDLSFHSYLVRLCLSPWNNHGMYHIWWHLLKIVKCVPLHTPLSSYGVGNLRAHNGG